MLKKFIILTIIISFINFQIDKKHNQLELNKINAILDSTISNLQKTIYKYYYITQTLDILVTTHEKINYNSFLKKIYYDNNEALKSIQIAPNGIIKYSYPYLENKKGMVNLLIDPKRKKEVQYTIKNKTPYLSGPYNLYQGDIGLIIRNPIFFKNKFWGLSIIIFNFNSFINESNILVLNNDYNYKIINEKIIYSNNDINIKNPISKEFYIFKNQKWKLIISPKNKIDYFKYSRYMLGILFSYLIALILNKNKILKILNSKIKINSEIDSLTKLYNNNKFNEVINAFLKKEDAFILFYFDLDNLKKINDTFGHNFGDKYIIESGDEIKKILDKYNGITFRIGGDEFLGLIKLNLDIKTIDLIINKIKSNHNNTLVLDKLNIVSSISCGYSLYPQESYKKDQLIKIADRRMYTDKANKKILL